MKSRESNIELLRLLCMFGIVLMHFIGLVANPGVWDPFAPLTSHVIAGTLVCSVTILSVNIFGLISGYFGIRFSWKRLLMLYLICAFYALIGCCVGSAFSQSISVKDWLLEIFLPFSHASGGLWYIRCYVGLMLFAPLLNKAIDHFEHKEYIVTLVLFTIANVYLGRFWKVPTYNVYGYSVAQLVYLYLIGGFIRRYVDLSKLAAWKLYVPLIVCVALWNVLTLIQHEINVPHWSPTSYNHVVIMVASACLFMLYLKHPFQNKWINYLAPGSLAIYLFHQNGHVWEILSSVLLVCECNKIYGGAILAILAACLCVVIVLFDKIRQCIFNIVLKK